MRSSRNFKRLGGLTNLPLRKRPIARALALWVLLGCFAGTAGAQHTEVQASGAGGKVEMDYNAAGKVTQTRTIAPDGKLQQKVDYEYLPGYYGAQQTDTFYWPDGKLKKVVRTTYDESANFTGEFIQAFDEMGVQTAGHRLTYDPWTGVYGCSEWEAAAKSYKEVECPEGEEGSAAKAEEPKGFTYAGVARQIAAARAVAQRQRKIEHMLPATPVQSPVTSVIKTIALVLPAQFRPGERISGTLVEDAEQYKELPEVAVVALTVPFESAGEGSRLWGWSFETEGERPQPADGPITFVVPGNGSPLKITLRQAGNPEHSVSQTVSLPQPEAAPAPTRSFHAPALCLKDGLCAVSGRFSGDGSKTFAAFDDRPARIVAETPTTAYISIPDRIEQGAHSLCISEGAKFVAFPMVVGEFLLQDNGRELQPAQSLIMLLTLEGPAEIPDTKWTAGNFPAGNLAQARRLIPDFQLPQGDRKNAKEPEAGSESENEDRENGEIVLVLKNITPGRTSLRNSKDGMLVFHLGHEAFSHGLFKYNLLVEAEQAGTAEVKGYVIPFLAPVAGQEFAVRTAEQKSK